MAIERKYVLEHVRGLSNVSSAINKTGYDFVACLPRSPCPLCGRTFTGPNLPLFATAKSEILADERILNLSQQTRKIILANLVEKKSPEAFMAIPISDFLTLAEVIREVMGLPENRPVLPGARTDSLRIRLFSKKSLPIALHDDLAPTMSVNSKLAEIVRNSELSGIGVLQCRVRPPKEERFELLIEGVGDVKATVAEIRDYYYFEGLVDEVWSLNFVRCPECHMFPRRRRLRNSGFTVESKFDFFQLHDFGGTYVSERGREFLTELSEGELEFLRV